MATLNLVALKAKKIELDKATTISFILMILNEKPLLSANVLWISSSESSGRFAGTGSVSQNWANEACDGLPPHYGQHHWWEDPGESLCQEKAREDGHSQKYVAGAENAALPTFGFNEINQDTFFAATLLTFSPYICSFR